MPSTKSQESWAVLRAQVARMLEEVQKLSASLERLASEHVDKGSLRKLSSHPVGRKRVVLDFLSYCWSVDTDNGYFGPPILSIESEFNLFVMWRNTIQNLAKRQTANEISTFAEYVACREGARKAFPQIWRRIQKGRKEELG